MKTQMPLITNINDMTEEEFITYIDKLYEMESLLYYNHKYISKNELTDLQPSTRKIVLPDNDLLMAHRLQDEALLKVETRLDYVSAITAEAIIPIYFYTQPQQCSGGFNDCDMMKDILEAIPEDVVMRKVEELTALGFEVLELALNDNIHFHPIGIRSWSYTDLEGCMKPDYKADKPATGSNMLYGFDGEFYTSVERIFDGNETYEFKKMAPVKIDGFTSSFEGIDVTHFRVKPFVPHKPKGWV